MIVTEVVPATTEVTDAMTTTVEVTVEPATTTESIIPSTVVPEEPDAVITTTQVTEPETTTVVIPEPVVPEETDAIITTTPFTEPETTTVVIPEPVVPEETDVTTEVPPIPETVTEISGNGTAAEVVKDKLSEQIRKILKHYQRPDPEGFPGAPIPEPMSIPPMKKSFGLADMTFTNMTVHGLSKFHVDRVNMDLKNMQVRMLIRKYDFQFEANPYDAVRAGSRGGREGEDLSPGV